MKCFYHHDLDGRCAGFWVSLSAGIDNLDHPRNFIEIDYKDSFPIDNILPHEQIYIVDYSIEPEMMEKLLSITHNVTWIDHHKTAIEKYKDFPYTIRGIRYDGISGAMLTYCYLHHMTNRGVGDIKQFSVDMVTEAPLMTKLVSDWDVSKFEYGDKTRQFQAGSISLDLNPGSGSWVSLMHNGYVDDICNKGNTIIKYRDMWAADYVGNLGFAVEIEGYNCWAVNLGRCNSEYFKGIPGPDIYVPFVFDGKKYTVSLYSTTVDVSVIAKKYGGGGHKGASGFVCLELPFRKAND